MTWQSLGAADGLTAAVRCAPPENKPLPEEVRTCRRYLERELDLLGGNLRAVVCLGKLAFDVYLSWHSEGPRHHREPRLFRFRPQ